MKLGERKLGQPRKVMYTRVEDFVKKRRSSDPNLVTLQQTADLWPTIESDENSMQDLWYRILIYVGIAFVVILAYTRQLVISLIATMCYFMVFVTTLGIEQLAGKTIGVEESANLINMVAFSSVNIFLPAYTFSQS